MLQKIVLAGMRFHACHGAFEQERQTGAAYDVRIEVTTDFSRALLSDRLEDTVNYADIYQLVSNVMQTPSALLEHVAGRILRAVFKSFPQVDAIHLRLLKEHPPIPSSDCQAGGVDIDIKRSEWSSIEGNPSQSAAVSKKSAIFAT